MEFETLGVILAALSGLYALSWKNHACLKRVESKFNAHLDIEYVKDEITEIKDSIRQLK